MIHPRAHNRQDNSKKHVSPNRAYTIRELQVANRELRIVQELTVVRIKQSLEFVDVLWFFAASLFPAAKVLHTRFRTTESEAMWLSC